MFDDVTKHYSPSSLENNFNPLILDLNVLHKRASINALDSILVSKK